MKFSFASTIAAAAVLALAATSGASAADITVAGAQDTPTMTTARNGGVDIKVATADILAKSTGLINKNTLAMDNNIFVSRSNLLFSQNDRIKLAKKVEALVTSADASDMDTAVLSKNILKAVSGKDTDAATMTKVSAVVTAKGDAAMRGQTIADLVNTVVGMKAKESQESEPEQPGEQEQAIQSDTPRGVVILIGTTDILRQPTGVVNKNVAFSDNQIAIANSNLAPTQNDVVTLTGSAKVADAVVPASAIKVTEKAETSDDMSNVRVGFLYNKEYVADASKDMKKDEQLGFWGAGLGFGWRYPLGYWNLWGPSMYGGGCGLGLAYGPFFYC